MWVIKNYFAGCKVVVSRGWKFATDVCCLSITWHRREANHGTQMSHSHQSLSPSVTSTFA